MRLKEDQSTEKQTVRKFNCHENLESSEVINLNIYIKICRFFENFNTQLSEWEEDTIRTYWASRKS